MPPEPDYLGQVVDPAANAVQSVAKSKPASMLDDIAGDLAGKAPPAGPGIKLPYVNGESLDDMPAPPTLAAQPKAQGSEDGKASDHNTVGHPMPIQFIHYSVIHDTSSARFAGKSPSRGVAMRDALLREIVLMSGYAQGARDVMLQHGQSGALGEAVAAVGSLLGGSHSAPAGPEQFDPVIKQLTTISASINKASFAYVDINQAGRKLHDARNAYTTACANALKPGGSGGGLPSLPTIPGIGGAVEIVAKLPGWLFKAQDAYLATFAAVRNVCEAPIARACHDFSFDAVKATANPCFEIWFTRSSPNPAGGDKDNPGPVPGGFEDTFDSLKKTPGKIENAASAEQAQNSLTDWMQTSSNGPSGAKADALTAALEALAGDPMDHTHSGASQAMCMGLAKGIGFDKGQLPAPLDAVAARIAAAALTIVRRVYTGILERDGQPSTLRDVVHAAVHDSMSSLIVDEVWALVGLGNKGPGQNKASHDHLGSLSVGLDQVENKVADMINKELAKQGQYLDGITDFVTHDLTSALQQAAAGSVDCDALTMESYLGRLPLALALLMRDIVFPLFNLVLRLFGLGNKLTGVVWDPVAAGLSDASGIANQLKATKDRIDQGATNASKQAGTIDQDIDKARQLGLDSGQAASGKSNDPLAAQKTLVGDAKQAPGKVAGPDSKAPSGWQPPDDSPEDTQNAKPLNASRIKQGNAQKPTPGKITSVGYLDAPPPKP